MLTLDKAVSDLFIAAKIHIIHDNAKYYLRKITIEQGEVVQMIGRSC